MRNFIDIINKKLTPESTPEVLLEGKQYLDMFKWLDDMAKKYLDPMSLSAMGIPRAKIVLKNLERNDIQTWAGRLIRIYLTDVLANMNERQAKNYLMDGVDYEEFTTLVKAKSAEYRREYLALTGSEVDLSTNPITNIENLWINHYRGINYHKIAEYRFDPKKSLKAVWKDLDALEMEYSERAAGLVVMEEGDEIIKNFGNGFVWMMLSRGYCRKEADAMGHCGNAGAKSGDRILSLRKFADKVNGVDHYNSVLTFILERDGYLGEMKGRANEKPAERYHPYIVTLLKMDIIKGIRGGGYAPENNFAINDLASDQIENLLKEKPQLGNFSHRLKYQGITEDFKENLLNYILKNLNGFYSYQHSKPPAHWVNDEIHFKTWQGIGDLVPEFSNNQTAVYISSDDMFDHWDFGVHRDSVISLVDDLPLQYQIKLGEYVASKMNEDELEDFDPTDTGEIVRYLEDNDEDEIYDSLRSACDDAHRSGAIDEAVTALFNAIKDSISEMAAGELRMDDEKMTWDTEFTLVMSAQDAARIADNSVEDEDSYDLSMYEILWGSDAESDQVFKVEEPYYGWSGYDSKHAVSQAIEMLPDFGIETQRMPFFDEMSMDDIRAEMQDIYDKIPDGHIRKVDLSTIEDSRLAQAAKGLWVKYYSKG